jgi:hypothetical protein
MSNEDIMLHVMTRRQAAREAEAQGGDFEANKDLPLPPPEETIPELIPAPLNNPEVEPPLSSSDPEPVSEQHSLSKILSRNQLVRAYTSREWSEEKERVGEAYVKGTGSNSDLWFSQGKIVVPSHPKF